ncbi:DUF2482 family protein [Staphylococcus aureus]|nr:DUF2482 family protein [Staphylococcus aureus]
MKNRDGFQDVTNVIKMHELQKILGNDDDQED